MASTMSSAAASAFTAPETTGMENENMQTIKKRLQDLRAELHTLREQEVGSSNTLINLQERLREIDAKRVEGKFYFDGQIPAGQAELVEMIEECYGIVYEIQNGARLLHTELKHVQRQLHALQHKPGKPTYTDLAPIQDRLVEVSQKLGYRRGSVPAKVGALNELLNELYDTKSEIESKLESED